MTKSGSERHWRERTTWVCVWVREFYLAGWVGRLAVKSLDSVRLETTPFDLIYPSLYILTDMARNSHLGIPTFPIFKVFRFSPVSDHFCLQLNSPQAAREIGYIVLPYSSVLQFSFAEWYIRLYKDSWTNEDGIWWWTHTYTYTHTHTQTSPFKFSPLFVLLAAAACVLHIKSHVASFPLLLQL